MTIRGQAEAHIEVHKYSGWAIWSTALLALLLQAFLPVYAPWSRLLELPLLVTLYFGLSRRNPNTGLLLGMTIGLLQDAVSGSETPVGLYGIAKTWVGFGASSIGGRLDVEHPVSRFVLTLAFFHFHQIIFALTKRLLLAQAEPLFTWDLLLASAVNAALAVALFPLLDRFRKAQ